MHLNYPTGFVYVARNLGCSKEYVGITVRHPEVRWLQHVRAADAGSMCAFHIALRQFGVQSFKFEVVWEGRASELAQREQAHIKERNTLHPFGYNMTPGGSLPPSHLPETRNMLRLGVADIAADPLIIPHLTDYKPRQRGTFCCLSFIEACRLIDFNVWPVCTAHHHLRKNVLKAGNYKALETATGQETNLVLPYTELTSMVKWDWNLKRGYV